MMFLTEGEILLAYADAVAEARAHKLKLRSQQDRPHGHLRIGSPPSFLVARLSAPLQRYHQRWPGVRLEVSASNLDDLPQAVASGQLDCGLLPVAAVAGVAAAQFMQLGLDCELIWREPLVMIQSSHMPLFVNTMGSLRDCPYHALLAPGLISDVLGDIDEVLEVSSCEALLANVVSGRCRAIVPQSLWRAQRDLTGMHAQEVGEVGVWLLWRQPFYQSAFDALRELLVSQGRYARRWQDSIVSMLSWFQY